MPKKETEAEFQKRTFPAKIKRVKEKTDKVLARGSRASKEDRAKAFKARKAADRVERRLKTGSGSSKPAERKDSTKPTKKKPGSALEGVKALLDAGKTIAGLPGREKAALKKIQKDVGSKR